MNFKKTTVHNFVLISITEIFGFISNYFIIYFISQTYPPEIFVLYPFATAFLLLFFILANFGLGTTIIKQLSAHKERNLSKTTKIIIEGFRLELLFTLLMSLLLFFLSDLIEKIYNMPNLGLILRFASVYLFFTNLIFYFDSVFQGLWKFKIYSLSSINLNALKLVIIILNFIIISPIYIIMAFFAIISVIQFSVLIIIIQFKYRVLSKIFKFDSVVILNQLKISFTMFLPILLTYLIINLNQFILALYINPRELAYYYIAFIIMQLSFIPIYIFIRLTFPYVSHYFQDIRNNMKILEKIYNSIFKYGFLIVLPLSFYIFYFSDYIIILIFGNKYYPAVIYIKVFIFYLNIRMLVVSGEFFLLASDQYGIVLKLTGITAFFTLLLSLVLIPVFFIYGAILAIIIPHSIYLIYSNILVSKKHNIKFDFKILTTLLKYLFSSLASILFVFLFQQTFRIDLYNLNYLIMASIIFLSTFLFFIFILKALRINEIFDLFKTLKYKN